MPYTYTDVEDSVVKLVKGGVVVGSNLGDTVTKWPSSDVEVSYGGVSNLWGTTLAPADVNASNFGVVLSALNVAGTAKVDRIAVRVHFSLPTSSDNPSYLVAVEVGEDRSTVTPRIYALPRAGLSVANDPYLDLAASSGALRTSRIYAPDRNIEKAWLWWEFYAEIAPANCAGLEVWGCVDDGTPFQLLTTADGTQVARFTTTGSHVAYFPAGTEGRWCYIEYRIATPSPEQAKTAVQIYDQAISIGLKPRLKRRMFATIVLGGGEFADMGSMRRTTAAQRALLDGMVGEMIPYRAPGDSEGYARLVAVRYDDVQATATKKWTARAQLQMDEVIAT